MSFIGKYYNKKVYLIGMENMCLSLTVTTPPPTSKFPYLFT